MRSCNPFFWHIGLDLFNLGETKDVSEMARGFGLGRPTGVVGLEEEPGQIPDPANQVDAVNMAIGQGDVLVTPLQLAGMYAALANGGTRYQPQVVSKVTRVEDPTLPPGDEGNYEIVRQIEPVEQGRIAFTPDQYRKIFEGLLGATSNGDGTANSSFRASPTTWPMAGKTGTAQVVNKADSALFAGWGPAVPGFPPRYAISVVVPEAGFGGDVAAPLAFRILQPVSKDELPPACPVIAQAQCEEAVNEALAAAVNDVGSGGPG
jgi:penicillin-binding protein 2